MKKKVVIMCGDDLISQGFCTPDESHAAKNHPDGFAKETGDTIYFRSDVDLKMGDFTYDRGAGAPIVDQQGEGANRKGPPSKPRE